MPPPDKEEEEEEEGGEEKRNQTKMAGKLKINLPQKQNKQNKILKPQGIGRDKRDSKNRGNSCQKKVRKTGTNRKGAKSRQDDRRMVGRGEGKSERETAET